MIKFLPIKGTVLDLIKAWGLVATARPQRDQEFSIPGFPGRDFAKSRDPGIFRDGISLKFLSQDYTKKVLNLWGFHYQLINLVNFIHFGGLICL